MSTTRLRIPESQREDLRLVLSLDDIQTEALVRALDEATLADPSGLADGASVPNADAVKVLKAINALRILVGVREHENTDLPTFVTVLIEALSGDEELSSIVGQDTEGARARLTKLLKSAEFSVGMKAYELGHTFERELYGVKVITDLRPVFRDSVSEPPAGVIIVHTLEIEYHSREGHEALFLAVPEERLRDLQNAVARALQKSETLQMALKDTASFAYLGHRNGD